MSSSSSSSSSSTASSASVPVPQYRVQVWLYDLSMGMAKAMSSSFLGRQIDGIWHTGVVVYGYEYFYGGGIQATRPGNTMAGQPIEKIDMGFTSISQDVFHQFLQGVSSRFTPATYSLLSHNCNNFSHEAVKFLTGLDIPAYITGLPEEALSTPMGMMLRPMIEQMERQFRQGGPNGGGSGGGFIPWSNEQLSLPPLDAQPDRYHAETPAMHVQAAASTTIATSHHDISAPGTTICPPAPAGRRGSSVGHPHSALPLQLLSASTQPVIIVDKKHASFLVLIKQAAKKVAGGAGLSDDERATLEALVHALAKVDDPAAATGALLHDLQERACVLFERLLRDWPAEHMFGVLGLFRVFLVCPTVLARYDDDNNNGGDKSTSSPAAHDLASLLTRVLAVVPSIDRIQDDATVPMAAQSMALCTVANMFSRTSIAARVSHSEQVVDACRAALRSPHKSVRVLAATLLFNCVLALPKDESDEVMELVSLLSDAAQAESDPDTAQRLLLALGHLIYGNASAALVLLGLDWTVTALQERFGAHVVIARVLSDINAVLQHEQKQMTMDE